MEMKALYYPYARSFNRVMLKQAILLFDEVWFADPVGLTLRKQFIDQHTGPARTHLDEWQSISEDYDFLIEQGVVNVFDPVQEWGNHLNAKYLQDLVLDDLQDEEFVATASTLASRDHWQLIGKRMPSSDFFEAVVTFLKRQKRTRPHLKVPRVSKTLRTVNIPDVEVSDYLHGCDKLDHYRYGFGHYTLPSSCGYSLNINQGLLFSEKRDWQLLTDDGIALRLLNRKYLRAKTLLQHPATIPSVLLERTPEHFSKYNVLALNLIKSLIPSEELDKRSFAELIKFKKANSDLHDRFCFYLTELTSQLESEPWSENFGTEVLKLIDKKVIPEVNKVRTEMSSSYEKMFGSILTKTVATITPTLAMSLFSGLTSGQILSLSLAAVSGVLSLSFPDIVDLWQSKRKWSRSAVSFLLKLE
jgi:hypothetical protein